MFQLSAVYAQNLCRFCRVKLLQYASSRFATISMTKMLKKLIVKELNYFNGHINSSTGYLDIVKI